MIPTHDCAGYLREALGSVLAQDPGPARMQIEVVDDASSDNPQGVVEQLGEGRVGFFRQPRNVGHSANFNACLARSRGRLVHLLHGDDCVRDGFYAAMERLLEREADAGAAFCRYIAMDEHGTWGNPARLEQRDAGVIPGWLERIAVGQRLQTPCMVVRREVYERLGGYDSRPRGLGEDWEMWVRIASRYPVAYLPEPLALYRVHSDSLSGGMLRSGANVADLRRVIAINREHLPPARAGALTRRALRVTATTCLRRARRALGRGDVATARAQLREAVRLVPALLRGAP